MLALTFWEHQCIYALIINFLLILLILKLYLLIIWKLLARILWKGITRMPKRAIWPFIAILATKTFFWPSISLLLLTWRSLWSFSLLACALWLEPLLILNILWLILSHHWGFRIARMPIRAIWSFIAILATKTLFWPFISLLLLTWWSLWTISLLVCALWLKPLLILRILWLILPHH